MNKNESNQLVVFLCYASEDLDQARNLYENLKQYTLEIWFDKESLLPGQRYDLEIKKAIRNADIIIILITKNFEFKEGYLVREVNRALDKAEEKHSSTIFIIPVTVGNVEIPEELEYLQYVDIKSKNGFEKLMEAICTQANEYGKPVKKLANDNPIIILPNAFYSSLNRLIDENLNILSAKELRYLYMVVNMEESYAPKYKSVMLDKFKNSLFVNTIRSLSRMLIASKEFNYKDVQVSIEKIIQDNPILQEIIMSRPKEEVKKYVRYLKALDYLHKAEPDAASALMRALNFEYGEEHGPELKRFQEIANHMIEYQEVYDEVLEISEDLILNSSVLFEFTRLLKG